LENEELRTGELVDLMVLPQSTISSQLLALQKKKLVRRRRSRKDNRSVMVSLTPAGLELARDCNALSVRAHHALLDGIPQQERDVALAFLRKMCTRLVDLEQQELVPFHPMEELAGLDEEAAPARRARRGAAGARDTA
ncbi:MAG TPA: MarR family transcriptional regulator, partial [Ramlibacter sp.]|nr:MarR family transcriptional regulator [Ramlibacter sp.]